MDVAETERMRVLREAATVVAKSNEVPTASAYAVARELWGLWWAERDRRLTECLRPEAAREKETARLRADLASAEELLKLFAAENEEIKQIAENAGVSRWGGRPAPSMVREMAEELGRRQTVPEATS